MNRTVHFASMVNRLFWDDSHENEGVMKHLSKPYTTRLRFTADKKLQTYATGGAVDQDRAEGNKKSINRSRLLSLVLTFTFGRRKRHGFNPGSSVVKPASFGHGCHFPTVTQEAIRIIRISPELFQEMLNRSISVVCLMRSMVNYNQFQSTDHVQVCCGCVPASTIIYGFLRSVAVDYGSNEIFEHVENCAIKKN